MPLKKSIRMRKSPHVNKSTQHLHKAPRLKRYTPPAGRIRAGTIVLAVICVVAAAMLIAGHQPYHPAAIVSEDTQTRTAALQDAVKTAALQEGANTALQDGAKKAAAMAPAVRAVVARTPADATAENAPPAELARKAPEPNSTQVTITGCLERADDTFRLKDATGVEAPRSRSWKSGFLKKGPASIEIVDTANGLKLPDHVGQRVSVTGNLIDRAMHVRSMQRVAASCTNSARVRI
jgi:hypothetical protein